MNALFATTLETLLNQALESNPSSSSVLSKLAHKIIRIELTDIAVNFTLFPDEQNIIVLSDYYGEVDVLILGGPFSLLHLLTKETLTNNPNVTVKGDLNVAQQFQELLQNLNIDWEKQLAPRFGALPANKLTGLFRYCQTQAHNQLNTFPNILSEYLQARHLPTRIEVEIFFNAVATLQDDLECLEQRVQQLL